MGREGWVGGGGVGVEDCVLLLYDAPSVTHAVCTTKTSIFCLSLPQETSLYIVLSQRLGRVRETMSDILYITDR